MRTETLSSCRSCNAEIFWAITEASLVEADQKRMPVDYSPHREGNVEIVDHARNGQPIVRVHTQPPLMPSGPLHLSHFVTCEQRNEWRKQ